MKLRHTLASMLIVIGSATAVHAQEMDDLATPNPIDVCENAVVLCLPAAALVAGAAVLYAVGEAWEMACGQPLLAPDDPENTASNDWQYQCPIARAQPVPS